MPLFTEIAPGVEMVAVDGDPVLHHQDEFDLLDRVLPPLEIDAPMPNVKPTRIPPGPAMRSD